ncbi:MAG: alpha-galactosidase, partial [Clostridia bacterium]|nr:alpha-galactosidase [Clostridia bacterium]
LTVELTVEFPAKNAITTLLRITNNGRENSPQITNVRSLNIDLPFTGEITYSGLSGDDCGERSFVPFAKPLSENRYHVEPHGGRSSNVTGFPFFDLSDGKTTYVCAIGWTGQWSLDLLGAARTANVQVGLCDCDFYLKPSESVRFPLCLVMEGGEPILARADFRDLMREKFSPKAKRKEDINLPVSIQPFDRYFAGQCGTNKDPSWNTEEGQLREVAVAAKCGFDTVWLDAAWFPGCFPLGVGNYSFVPGFPNGLKKVSDAAHEKGMRFVLWFEPERIHKETETWRNHPEFLLVRKDAPDDALFNLAEPAAREYLTAFLGDMIAQNGVDIYRQDQNCFDVLDFWRAFDEENRKGVLEMHYVEGLYRLWDDLTARFPHLMIDNCASGGRRMDLETAKRAVNLWRSDTGCFPEHENFATSVWNNLQTLSLNRYLPYTCSGVWESVPYDMRGAATGGVACNFDVLNPNFNPDSVKAVIEEAKRTRYFWNGTFFPLTEPNLKTDDWAAYQLERDGKGIAYFFRKKDALNPIFCTALYRIDPDKTYRVTITDEAMQTEEFVLPGEELATDFWVKIDRKRASALVEYEPIEAQ